MFAWLVVCRYTGDTTCERRQLGQVRGRAEGPCGGVAVPGGLGDHAVAR